MILRKPRPFRHLVEAVGRQVSLGQTAFAPNLDADAPFVDGAVGPL